MAYRKLGRDSSARKALLRSIVTSLFQHERIETTEAKAKELRKVADKMLTLAKRGDLHARRQVLAYMMDEDVVKKLFDEIAPKYKDRQGGYTRIIKTGVRQGDAAPMAVSRAVPRAFRLATSRRKRRKAARSGWSRKAIRSRSTSPRAEFISPFRLPNLSSAVRR